VQACVFSSNGVRAVHEVVPCTWAPAQAATSAVCYDGYILKTHPSDTHSSQTRMPFKTSHKSHINFWVPRRWEGAAGHLWGPLGMARHFFSEESVQLLGICAPQDV